MLSRRFAFQFLHNEILRRGVNQMKYTDEDVRKLVEAVTSYKKEWENPVPDYEHRRTLRRWIFEAVEPFQEKS